jgi:hypothetical protein
MISETLIDALWAQIEPFAYITREQFARGLDAWEVEPVEIDGRLAFATLVRGPEFHFTSFETGARVPVATIWARVEPIMARYGFVTTRTPKDEPRQHRFNKLLGFRPIGEDEFCVHYRLESPCQ